MVYDYAYYNKHYLGNEIIVKNIRISLWIGTLMLHIRNIIQSNIKIII